MLYLLIQGLKPEMHFDNQKMWLLWFLILTSEGNSYQGPCFKRFYKIFFILELFIHRDLMSCKAGKVNIFRMPMGNLYFVVGITGELNGGGVDAKIIARSKEGSITVKTQSWFDSLGLGT